MSEPFAVARAKRLVNSVALRSMFIAGFAYYEIGRFVLTGTPVKGFVRPTRGVANSYCIQALFWQYSELSLRSSSGFASLLNFFFGALA